MDAHSAGRSTASPEQVWSVLSAIDTWPEWTPTVTSVERLPGQGATARTDGPEIGVGSVFTVTQPRLGRATWEVTEWEPGRGFTWVSRRTGVRTTAVHRLRPEGSGTGIELGISWEGPGAWLVRAIFGPMTQRYTDNELAALIAAAESSPVG